MKLKNICNSLFILLLLTGCTNAKPVQPKGPAMPDFKFYRLDNTPFTRADIKAGSKSVIILFDTSCEHCQHEIQDIGKRYNDFKNVNFYLVSFDERLEIHQFMNSFGKLLYTKRNVTVLWDSDRQFIPKFQPTRFPAIYVYGANKELISYFGGQKDVADVIKATNK